MNPSPIKTTRLTLVAATPELLCAELAGTDRIGAALEAGVPADWPPGEYDRAAIEFFLTRLTEGGPDAVGWYGASVAVLRRAGFHEAPSAQLGLLRFERAVVGRPAR